MKRTLLKAKELRSAYSGVTTEKVTEIKEEPNLISSQIGNGRHAPTLDIDFPVYAIPSSTPGHFHLFIEKEMSWPEYQLLLSTLKTVGIIEEGYYNMAMERGQTQVRAPWVKK